MSKHRKSAKDKDIKDKSREPPILNLNLFCTCLKCNDPVIEDPHDPEDVSIGCNSCKQWFHVKCTDLTNDQFQFLVTGGDSIVYVCIDCALQKRTEAIYLKDLRDEISVLAKSVNNVDKKLESFVTMQMVEDKIDEKFDKKFKEMEEKLSTQVLDKSKIELIKEIEVNSQESDEQEKKERQHCHG